MFFWRRVGEHIKENWHTFCFMFAIRNLCMTSNCHATTGSNMKNRIFYPGSSPQGNPFSRSMAKWVLSGWLALAPFVFILGQVTITCPPTVNISCSTPPTPANTGTATATTGCSTSSAVTVTSQDNTGQMNGCMGTGTLRRTWTAVDQCGASATCVQSIIVEDNTSPTLTCPPFMVISCETDTTTAQLGIAVASDNCTPVDLITISYTDQTQNLGQCNGTGTFTRHWVAEDMCGNVASCIQTIVIVDNTAPVLTIPASLTISCEESTTIENTGNAIATDNCTESNDIIIAFSDNVLGMNGCSGTGTIVRSWIARDGCNNFATGTQFITVQDNTPPQITCPANITISCEASSLPAATGTITATDLCGAVFTGFTDQVIEQVCNGTGIVERHWSAIDGCGNVSSCIQLITIIDQIAPTVTCPATITVDCSVGVAPAVTGSPVVSDNCTGVAALTVTYTDIEIVPLECNNTGTLERTWIVTDACGNSTSCTQLIHITDTLKPTLTCPPPATISCESSVSPDFTGEATASDNCTPESLLVIEYSDDESLLFGCNGTGILNRTWSATDLCGNVTTCVQQIWIIDDTDPVITCPPNVEISCSDSSLPAATGYATATDNCTSFVAITYTDNTQLNDCNNTGLILRMWSASDACGNVRTCTQLITVVDRTAPIIVCPRDTLIDCGFYNNPDALGYPTGTDNCSSADELVLDYDDDLSGLTGCTNTGIILRTWYMTDACGNTGSCVQRITVADTTAPVIVCPADVVINCQDSTSPQIHGKATATDYCTASLFIDITYEDDMSEAGQCNGSGYIYRTWKATDDCGNVATCIQTIEIIDDEAPEIQCPASYAISCEADRSPEAQGYALATDNCTQASDIEITYKDDVTNLTGCNNTGNLYRTWTAKDACGNKTTCVQVMTIVDTKAPVVTPPAPITVSCESSLDVAVTGDIQASDNCTAGALLNVVISDDATGIVGCNHTGTLKRTWVVSDLCGNSKSVTQTIRIVDTTKPSITCAASLQVNCGDSLDPSALGSPEISDNCTAPADMDLLHFDNTTGLNGCNGTGTMFRTWVVYDDCGNSNSCIQTIEVVDQTAPVIALPANLTTSCEYADDIDELGVATAIDGCTPASDIEITYSDNDEGLSFCNSTGQRQRVWKATDLCGNFSTAIQYIQFIDTLAPIFYTPFDVVIDCDDNPVDLDYTGEVDVYTDNCAEIKDVDITWHDDMAAIQDCDGNPVIQRVWTLTDPCGNARSSVQQITVMNYSMNQVEFPADAYIPCDADMMDLSLTGNLIVPENACAYLMDTMYAEELGEIAPYQFGRKWVCIDYCGHVEEHTQMIYLIDEVRPELTVQDIFVSFHFGDTITLTPDQLVVNVEDNCDPEVSLAMSQVVLTCEDFMTDNEVLIEITATDDQGNQTIEEIIVTLQGGLFIMDCPDDIQVYLEPGECGAVVNYTMTPQGLCSMEPIISQIDGTGLISGDYFPVGITELVFMVSDDLGYSEECSFTVEVVEYPEVFALACQDTLHVSVALDCEAVITADMLLEGDEYGCYDQYIIEFSDPAVQFQNGVLLAGPHIGEFLEACITDPETGNFCCSKLLIEDKLPPSLICSDITLECTDDIRPQAIPHYPVPADATVTPIGGNQYTVSGIDNCGPTIISYTDVEDIHMCDGIYANIITRTWTAVDPSGHSATCQETLYLLRGTIDQFVLPGDTTIYCGNECIRPDGTPDPACIGGITGPFCGTFFVGYIDKVIPYCGSSYTVKREWSLVDWCNAANIIEYVQLINVEDNEAPIIACEDIIYSPSDFGDCGAEVRLTPPAAYDGCGSDPLTYVLKLNGQVVLPVNGEYILPPLSLGQYEITWEVRDDCDNLAICNTTVDLFDSTPPTAYCDAHTVIAINNQDPMGVALLPATTLDDGSFDNCGPVTFRARRMDSCIDFDWTTDGFGHQPDGDVDNFDRGLLYSEYVPVSCCDAGQDYILVQLEVKDLHGNVNYCMVEVEVQDKVAPMITCPPDISVSCQFWFDPNVLEDPNDRTFGTVVDGFQYDQSARQNIVINDPGNPEYPQPHLWGRDGYVTDNCNLEMDIRVTVFDDCSGDDLPGDAPAGAVKLVQRRFTATDPAGRIGFCTQRIWVINFDPFYINNDNHFDPTDDVIWPSDVEVDHCGIPDTIPPIILNEACAQIGVNMKERRFEQTEGACVKILRDWTVIDWCQYDTQTGAGIWRHTQVVKITDDAGALFTDCNDDIRIYCTLDEEVTEVVDPAFETTCFVHLDITKHIEDICSNAVQYDVKIYPPNSSVGIVAVAQTEVEMNADGTFDLPMNTAFSPNLTLRTYGMEYNNPNLPNEHYKVLWSVWDGCGNLTTCEDRIRLEDCKKPTPVCINGLSTVPMPSTGSVTIWAKDFDASSFDNCTSESQLRFSFSGSSYQPSRTFTCEDILALGVQQPIDVFVWDNWNNTEYCSTTIVFTDPSGVCGLPSGGISGVVSTPAEGETVSNVGITLRTSGQVFGSWTTAVNGAFQFPVVPAGQMYTLEAERNDNHKNGVSTLDLVRLQQHLLGLAPFNSPYLLIAADANNSGNVSALDLIEIRKLILGKYEQFPNNTSWMFIPESYVFADPYNPWPFDQQTTFMVDNNGVIEDFMGVKIGDLNASVTAHAGMILPRSEASVAFEAVDRFVSAGEEFEVEFRLEQLGTDMLGGQWDLLLDGAVIERITPLAEGLTEEMWSAGPSNIRFAWTPKEAVETSSVIKLVMKAISSGKISDKITVDHSFLVSEMYDAYENVYEVSLDWKNEDEMAGMEEIQLHQNRPNPWDTETVIPFEIAEPGEVSLSITNALGEEMTILTQTFAAGKQQFKITNHSWPQGLYYYTIRSGDTQLTKTMLILNKH
jgi:hypothetical protein